MSAFSPSFLPPSQSTSFQNQPFLSFSADTFNVYSINRHLSPCHNGWSSACVCLLSNLTIKSLDRDQVLDGFWFFPINTQ